jgi:hypothetical protein
MKWQIFKEDETVPIYESSDASISYNFPSNESEEDDVVYIIKYDPENGTCPTLTRELVVSHCDDTGSDYIINAVDCPSEIDYDDTSYHIVVTYTGNCGQKIIEADIPVEENDCFTPKSISRNVLVDLPNGDGLNVPVNLTQKRYEGFIAPLNKTYLTQQQAHDLNMGITDPGGHFYGWQVVSYDNGYGDLNDLVVIENEVAPRQHYGYDRISNQTGELAQFNNCYVFYFEDDDVDPDHRDSVSVYVAVKDSCGNNTYSVNPQMTDYFIKVANY